jgi:hypothetical protein
MCRQAKSAQKRECLKVTTHNKCVQRSARIKFLIVPPMYGARLLTQVVRCLPVVKRSENAASGKAGAVAN